MLHFAERYLVSLFVIAALSQSTAHAAPQIGDPAPMLVLQQANGRIFKLEHIHAPVVVVDFYATWCGPCQLAMKALGAALAPFGDRAQLVIVDVGEDPEKLRAFLAANPPPPGAIVVCDPFASVAKIWGETKLPTTFLLDQAHVIRKINRGYGAKYGERMISWLRGLGLESAPEEKR